VRARPRERCRPAVAAAATAAAPGRLRVGSRPRWPEALDGIAALLGQATGRAARACREWRLE
jgi:hypothetical protein